MNNNLPILSNEGGLSAYLEQIKKFPMFDAEEEYMLAKNWKTTGNIKAAEKLVTSHLRLVAKIAMGYKGYGLPINEMISEGNVGLMQAVKKFEPEKGFRLATYAMWWIKASIQEYILRSWSLVKIGTTTAQKKLFFNFNFIENCLAVGLENHYLIKTKKKHENVDREISTGAEIQSQLLPDYCPIIHGIDLAAHCRPALQLGGDYYDFMCLKTNISEKRKEKSRWAFVIGDVMGKGIPAGLLMTMLRGMLRAEVLTGLPPDRILHDLNQLALNDLDQSHRFVTLFYSDYDPRTRKLRFANAAHNPPLLWKSADQKIVKIDSK